MSINSVNERLEQAIQDQKYEGYVVGFVTENNDPLGISRIKVKIPNVLDTDQGPVPWCLPSKKSPFGQGPNYGVYGTPKIGSAVRVTFQDGDPHCPVYECDEFLKAFANAKFNDPNTWGFKDPGGSELWVNYSTGAWEFTHQSGDYIKYDGAGNVTIYNKSNREETTDGDSTETIKGKFGSTITGDSSNSINGSLNFTVQGDVNITASGTVNISGSTVNLN